MILRLLLASLYATLVTQPYVYRFQNALESCLYGATALFLALAMVYTALPANPAAARVSVEALMAIVLLGTNDGRSSNWRAAGSRQAGWFAQVQPRAAHTRMRQGLAPPGVTEG